MNIVFEEEFGKVWTDNLTPYIFTLITKIPPASSTALRFFKAQLDLSESLRKKYKEAYLISDFSQTDDATRDILCHYYMEFIPKLIKSKISYITFVCPHKSFDALPAEKKEKFRIAPLSVFPTFVEALSATNLKRSLLLAQKFERIPVL